jgi:hypothetical protein
VSEARPPEAPFALSTPETAGPVTSAALTCAQMRDIRSWRRGSFSIEPVRRPGQGPLGAAESAEHFGLNQATVFEVDVASGCGLTAMLELGRIITAETRPTFQLYGFDTGVGLPAPRGSADHSELWNRGVFFMADVKGLRKRQAGGAQLVIGDIAQTIDAFTRSLNEEGPPGLRLDRGGCPAGNPVLAECAGHPRTPHVHLSAIGHYFGSIRPSTTLPAAG